MLSHNNSNNNNNNNNNNNKIPLRWVDPLLLSTKILAGPPVQEVGRFSTV
jgi:hypothetical protein